MNSEIAGSQSKSSLAQLDAGRFVAVWNSAGDQDGSSAGIFAQIFESEKNKITLTSNALAIESVSYLDRALHQVNSGRAVLGSFSNRLDHIIENNTHVATNVTNSLSRIQDADFALETANLSRAQILQQAGTAMVAQANQLPQQVLKLLQ